jgi:hypothetical protein
LKPRQSEAVKNCSGAAILAVGLLHIRPPARCETQAGVSDMCKDSPRQHDFTDKTEIPFCSHGVGGSGQKENDIAKECPKSKTLPGIAVNGTGLSEDVTNWLQSIGL